MRQNTEGCRPVQLDQRDFLGFLFFHSTSLFKGNCFFARLLSLYIQWYAFRSLSFLASTKTVNSWISTSPLP